MDWITGLLKHITASNKLMLALLVTSIVVVIGPTYISFLKPIPEDWQWIPPAVGIFSLSMLVLSLISLSWQKMRRVPRAIRRFFMKKPQGLELELLEILGTTLGEGSLDLEKLDYSSVSRLEVLAARDSLQEKGLIECVMFYRNVIYITKEGRDLLLKPHKKQS